MNGVELHGRYFMVVGVGRVGSYSTAKRAKRSRSRHHWVIGEVVRYYGVVTYPELGTFETKREAAARLVDLVWATPNPEDLPKLPAEVVEALALKDAPYGMHVGRWSSSTPNVQELPRDGSKSESDPALVGTTPTTA